MPEPRGCQHCGRVLVIEGLRIYCSHCDTDRCPGHTMLPPVDLRVDMGQATFDDE